MTLTSLFDIDAGFLVNDAVVFSAEVRCSTALPDPPCYMHKHSSGHAQACWCESRHITSFALSKRVQCCQVMCDLCARCWC